MSEIFEIAGWFLLSSVKYPWAVIPLLANSTRFWYFDMLIVASGGCLGSIIFVNLGAVISKYFARFDFFKIKFKNRRRFVVIRKDYGLFGLAFLTPLLLSIPIGCIISAAFESNKTKVVWFQCASVVFWSILLFGLKGLFHINVLHDI